MTNAHDIGAEARKNGLGVRVRELRIAAGLTQDELAERSGLSVRTVRNLERGISRPHRTTTQLIATGLNLEDATGGPPPRTGALVPAELPFAPRHFVGRENDLRWLDGLIRAGNRMPMAVIVGEAGIGKTALAVHWSHRVRTRFPDGQLFVDLRGGDADRPAAGKVLGRLLRSLGVEASRVPGDIDEAAGLYRTMVSERRMLIVLDNAGDPAQIRPLLPGGSACFVVVTGRASLGELVAREGGERRNLGPLSRPESRTLLERVIGGPAHGEPAAVETLADLCGGVPLELSTVAANLLDEPEPVSAYAARLRSPLISPCLEPGSLTGASRW
jgi:transcriptional regulator with XRE-family HTH domain